MRKKLLLILVVTVLVCLPIAAESSVTSSVTIASMVKGLEYNNPQIVVGIGSAELSYYVSPDAETTYITGLDLQKDGSFSFALMTSQEVVIAEGAKTSSIGIEINAEGFNLYDFSYTGILDGSSMDEANIKQRNAVPLVTDFPEISIARFYGANENLIVNYAANGKKNKIEVSFKEGTTRSDLILGTFTVDWKGKKPLEAGIYKAKVSITYSKE